MKRLQKTLATAGRSRPTPGAGPVVDAPSSSHPCAGGVRSSSLATGRTNSMTSLEPPARLGTDSRSNSTHQWLAHGALALEFGAVSTSARDGSTAPTSVEHEGGHLPFSWRDRSRRTSPGRTNSSFGWLHRPATVPVPRLPVRGDPARQTELVRAQRGHLAGGACSKRDRPTRSSDLTFDQMPTVEVESPLDWRAGEQMPPAVEIVATGRCGDRQLGPGASEATEMISCRRSHVRRWSPDSPTCTGFESRRSSQVVWSTSSSADSVFERSPRSTAVSSSTVDQLSCEVCSIRTTTTARGLGSRQR